MNPKVTIIIPFYNCPYIAQAIKSAVQQTYDNTEIIVVDDGSTKYASLIKPYEKKVYYLGKANGGTATALNHGIRHASGEYVAWLSSDDLFYKNKVKHQVQFMQQIGAPISYTNFNYINKSGVVTRHAAGGDPLSPAALCRSFLDSNPVNGCTVMIRRDVFDQLGLFDEGLPYTHDYEYWMRAVLRGYTLSYLNENLTAYRWHSAMGTVRHSSVIAGEIEAVRSRYSEPLRNLAAHMPA
ncbi:glycosyltransferase [Paenibacillus tuaregi]|uniref:glycosyltransferase n=1 Tax=Paenibacillus tuaregi TaxID=1816681 RepID=UPI000838EE12|nr:glycosyltransferase [Paenibacillus tuaregi]